MLSYCNYIRKLLDEKTDKEYNVYMGNRIVHFEIEATNKERAKKFYEAAFGWKMDQMGEEFGGYITVTTGNPSEAGGKVLQEKPDDIPNIGLYIKCEDTEGNHFTLLQPSPRMAPK
jgi:predicted enzyme related to lactoylglutathione lyase